MDRTVKDPQGLAQALADLINRAGKGDLVGGRLESAIADTTKLMDGGVGVRVTVGKQVYLLRTEGLHRANPHDAS